jgi:hypothetical protein
MEIIPLETEGAWTTWFVQALFLSIQKAWCFIPPDEFRNFRATVLDARGAVNRLSS